MILLTGAAGKTGKAILRALSNKRVSVRAIVKTKAQASALNDSIIIDKIIGDLRNPVTLQNTFPGINCIYFICPNVIQEELSIGMNLIRFAQKFKINHFIYHSVLHSQIESMPHHWQKMRMEEYLFESGINFTILQPCAYMQNFSSSLKTISETGIYSTPYSADARISYVDLNEVGEVAAKVLTEKEPFFNSILELAGPEALSQTQVASIFSKLMGRDVVFKEESIDYWETTARKNGIEGYALETLIKMFQYYSKHGLIGNPLMLKTLLGRTPTDLRCYINNQIRELSGE